jgi:DNA-directed RNA polymerase subunit RPC12/RpoP
MPKKKENRCPRCGELATEPYKTWELVAPFPDKKMRITVTVFGMFKCASCGKSFRGLVSKAKLGAEGIEV